MGAKRRAVGKSTARYPEGWASRASVRRAIFDRPSVLIVVTLAVLGACGGKSNGAPQSAGAPDGGDVDTGSDSSTVADADAPDAAPPDGAPAVDILVSGEPPIVDLAVDGTHVYYVTSPAKLKRVPKTGGPAETVNDGSLDSGLAHAQLAMGPTHLFWANALDGVVARIDKTSGAMKILASEQGTVLDVAATSAHVLWGNNTGLQALATTPGSVLVTAASSAVGSGGLAATSKSAYLASNAGMILRFDSAGLGQASPGVVVAESQKDIAEMRADEDGTLYWALRGDASGCGSVIRRAKPAAAVEDWIEVPCLQTSCGDVQAFAVAGKVVFLGRVTCGLQRLDSATGQVVDLGPPNAAARIATDDASVFWATSSGHVMRTAKGEVQ